MPNKDVQEQAGRAAAFNDGVVHRSREQDFGACGEAGPAVYWEQTLISTSGERPLDLGYSNFLDLLWGTV